VIHDHCTTKTQQKIIQTRIKEKNLKHKRNGQKDVLQPSN
jgi:hypothetical protein